MRARTLSVFGEGSAASRVMLIGEVPGDREDLADKASVLYATDGEMRGLAREELFHDFAVLGEHYAKLRTRA